MYELQMRAYGPCYLLITVLAASACGSEGDPVPGDAGVVPRDTGFVEFTADMIPVDCLAPDGSYQLDGEDGQSIEAVIANGLLTSMGGEPCRFSLGPQTIRPRRQIHDDGCFNPNDWCEVYYFCDTRGLCLHKTFIYQDDPDGAKWVISDAANEGCARADSNQTDAWTLVDAPCEPICNGSKSCDGCGGDCQTGFKKPLGAVCDATGDCETGLRCVDWTATDYFRCHQPCTSHADCTGLIGLGSTQYRSCHSCDVSAGSATYPRSDTCIPVVACGAGGGGGQSCSECLATCRGLSSCCTGVGCICEDAC